MLTQPHSRRTSGGPKSHYKENKILYYNQSAIKRQDAGGLILQDGQLVILWVSFLLLWVGEEEARKFLNLLLPIQMVLEVDPSGSDLCRSHRFSTCSQPGLWHWRAAPELGPGVWTAMVWLKATCGVWGGAPIGEGLSVAATKSKARNLCVLLSSDLLKQCLLPLLSNLHVLPHKRVTTAAL